MSRLETGMIITTTYCLRVHRILEVVERGCTCLGSKSVSDVPSSPHIHMLCEDTKERSGPRNRYWLNGYSEETLCNVWRDKDIIIIAL